MTGLSPLDLRFSTADYSDRNRIEIWRDMFGHAICGLDIVPLGDQPFHSQAILRAMPGLGVAAGMSSGASYWRPAHLIANDDLVFVINHNGYDLARMSGKEEVLKPGDAVLFAADRIGGTTNKGLSQFTTLRIPRGAIAGADDAVLRPVKGENEALWLLSNYLSVLRDMKALRSTTQQTAIASHVHDLIAMALKQKASEEQRSESDGVAAARLFAIKQDVARSAINSSFNIATLAARHRVTPRYVQILFAREGTNFSDYLRTARLAAAHRMLVTDRTKSISDIALDTGFSTISYFNRAFRREFNSSPSDVRWRVAPDAASMRISASSL